MCTRLEVSWEPQSLLPYTTELAKDPHLFLGVVGFDFRMSAVDTALGANESMASLQRIIRRLNAKCPTLELTLCEL
jgi:hypothetical protein